MILRMIRWVRGMPPGAIVLGFGVFIFLMTLAVVTVQIEIKLEQNTAEARKKGNPEHRKFRACVNSMLGRNSRSYIRSSTSERIIDYCMKKNVFE